MSRQGALIIVRAHPDRITDAAPLGEADVDIRGKGCDHDDQESQNARYQEGQVPPGAFV